MSGREFAGRLRQRVAVLRQTTTRDTIGGAVGAWEEIASLWAWIAIEGKQPPVQGEARAALPVWRVTMRPCAVAAGDRIGWGGGTMVVRTVRADPDLPDRLVAIGEELR